MIQHRALPLSILFMSLVLVSCGGSSLIAATPTKTLPTASPLPPTATPVPLAAVVNDRPLALAEFQAEVARFEAAQAQAGIDLATLEPYRDQVLQALIDMELLAGAADDDLSEAELDSLLEELSLARGGTENMASWLAANGYEVASLKTALRREILAQRTVQQLADAVPAEMEQVHASHILVSSQAEAEDLLAQLEDGADFAELAVLHSLDLSSRVGGGDLGWFPRGVLSQPEVEAAAFELEVGEISPVVESELGYHLIQVLDKGSRPLSPNDLRRLRTAAVEGWLQEMRATAQIEILIEP